MGAQKKKWKNFPGYIEKRYFRKKLRKEKKFEKKILKALCGELKYGGVKKHFLWFPTWALKVETPPRI